MRRSATKAQYWLLMLFLTGIVVQVYLAGYGLLGDDPDIAPHRDVGWIVHTIGLVIAIVAIVGRPNGTIVGMAIGLVVLNTVQIVLNEADSTAIAAFHPALALAVLGLALVLTMRVGAWLRADAGAPSGG